MIFVAEQKGGNKMTREEARSYIIRHCNPNYPQGKTEWECAINMAIEALSGESSDDTISRRSVIEALDHMDYMPGEWAVNGLTMCKDAIKALPSAQPEKRTETHSCDLIDRQAAIDMLRRWKKYETTEGLVDRISKLPSAQQDCTDCPEYDTERHYCPKYCEVIKQTVEEAKPERKTGKWIEYDNSHCECPFCHVEWSYFDNEVECFNYCPNCGARLEGEG